MKTSKTIVVDALNT